MPLRDERQDLELARGQVQRGDGITIRGPYRQGEPGPLRERAHARRQRCGAESVSRGQRVGE